MTKEYLIARLQEAAEEGWEKALATYEDDIAEGFEEPLLLNKSEEEYYLQGIENQAFWDTIEEHEVLEELQKNKATIIMNWRQNDNGLIEPINPYLI